MRAEKPRHLCFRLSCWTLGMIAFVQTLIAGLAVSVRVENAREVRVETRYVPQLIEVAPKPEPQRAIPEKPSRPVVVLPPIPDLPAEPAMPEARPLDAPPIADPVVERLVMEARQARVAEDMGSALVKLEEARSIAPKEPNVLYELGLVYETMAGHDQNRELINKASSAYQAVFELGTSGAGALYSLAAKKLTEGISKPSDMRGKLALGRVQIFKDKAAKPGQRVVLTIPVRAAPDAQPSADDFLVQVKFFDVTRDGKHVPSSPEAETEVAWVSGAFDWLGGEETVRVTYQLPQPDKSQDHLFGRRKYYGQVVELIYKNELIDSQAWPRHLAALSNSPLENIANEFPQEAGGVLPLLDLEQPLPPFEDGVALPDMLER